MLPELQADRTRAADLDAQILDPERSLATIRAERALVQERLDAYKYPILTLPNEIVSEIFLHFLPVYPACPPLYGRLSPTNLTRICREWRAVALATPALWRAFRVDAAHFTQVQTVETWLSISRSYPTSLEVHANVDEDPEAEVLLALARHRARWEHLKLHCSSLSRLYLLGFENPTPLLRHLDLAFDDSGFDLGSSGSIAFGAAPLLRSLVLNDVALEALKLIPWLQLTSLTLMPTLPSQCVPLLRQTPNLVHCYLAFAYNLHADAGTWSDMTLLRLESLVLIKGHTAFSSPTGDFLKPLTLPALRTLEVVETLLGIKPCDSLLSFIAKSGCKLEQICIRGKRKVSKDAYRRRFPSIQLSFQ
ncbi:hypothetical protein C8R46DRAFT_1087510 [Mycena filopes]|nr:hypothetical protein C8R46DRAFT_1087510 [Mycena filopes]